MPTVIDTPNTNNLTPSALTYHALHEARDMAMNQIVELLWEIDRTKDQEYMDIHTPEAIVDEVLGCKVQIEVARAFINGIDIALTQHIATSN